MSVNLDSNKFNASQPLFGAMALGTTTIISDFSGEMRASLSLFGKVEPAATAALGLTGCFNLVTGALAAGDGWAEAESCSRIGDVRGRIFGCARVFRGVLKSFYGALIIPLRGFTIANFLNAEKVDKASLQVIGRVGSAIFSIVTVLAMLIAANNFSHASALYNKVHEMKEKKGASAALTELKRELESGEVARANFRRGATGGCEKNIRNACIFQADEAVDKVLQESWKNQCFAVASLALSTIGLVSTGIIMLLNPANPLLATAAISAFSGAGWFIIDGVRLKESFEKCRTGKYDHLWVLTSSIVGIGAVGTALALSCGTSGKVAAAAVGGFWAGANLYWYNHYLCYSQKV